MEVEIDDKYRCIDIKQIAMGRYKMAALYIFTELTLYVFQDKEQIFALVHQEASKRRLDLNSSRVSVFICKISIIIAH